MSSECALCNNEIKIKSDRRVYQDESITIIHNIRPYYPDKIRESKQFQFLIMPNEHCHFEQMTMQTQKSIYNAKRYLLDEFGGQAYICGNNTGELSGASIPDHYHLHFTIIFNECAVCQQIAQGRGIIKEYDTVIILKDDINSSIGKPCFIITTKRHGVNPMQYNDLEVTDLISAETEIRRCLRAGGFNSLNTIETYGSQAFFDTPVVQSREITSCDHPCIRLVCRTSAVGFGNVTNTRFAVYHTYCGDAEAVVREKIKNEDNMIIEGDYVIFNSQNQAKQYSNF